MEQSVSTADKYTMWYYVMRRLQEVLKDCAPIVEIGAYHGGDYDVDENGAIFIVRGGLPTLRLYQHEEGQISLYLECWVRFDNNEVAKEYEWLARLERRVFDRLQDWIMSGDDMFGEQAQIQSFEVDSVLADGDVNYPYVADAILLSINYLKVRESHGSTSTRV